MKAHTTLPTNLRLALIVNLPFGQSSRVVSTLESVFEQFTGFKQDPDLQVHLWLTLVELFQENQSSWGKVFKLQKLLFQHVYQTRPIAAGPPKIWRPSSHTIENANITEAMRKLKINSFQNFHDFSMRKRPLFWDYVLNTLGVVFQTPPASVIDMEPPNSVENPLWFPKAKLNIVDSCFANRSLDATAISFQSEVSNQVRHISFRELEQLVNRIVNGLREHNFKVGDRISIDMPMTVEAVAIYLGVIKAGMAVVSIADSFAAAEIEKRNVISGAVGIVCVESYVRGGKVIPIYPKVIEANSPRAIVIPLESTSAKRPQLREGDILWNDFLSKKTEAESVFVDPSFLSNVLFSSGTTGDPKAIPWTHATPIKAATDGLFHHDIHPGDVVCWPTNLGWMMGPWLIYASFLNKASIALYYGAPTGRSFGEFIRNTKVTMLGLIPTIVKNWKLSGEFEGLTFPSIRVFSSTGECSNSSDYFWLMSLSGYKAPVIEYCGGTEIGGGYITGSVVQDAALTMFTTPALGSTFRILREDGQVIEDAGEGETFIVPPALGSSQTLLNRDHYEVYFAECPTGLGGEVLRRHGDLIGLLPGGFYCALGRMDDTMNLGGIKISSAELERAALQSDDINEVAAVGVHGKGGDRLVLFVVLLNKQKPVEKIHQELQAIINKVLNPLFKISQVVVVSELPKTASNKVMRRTLRDNYIESSKAARVPPAKL